MSEAITEAVAQTSVDGPKPITNATTNAAPATGSTDAGEAALGDAGKKALDAMKADRNAAREEARDLKARFEALEAKIAGKEAEFTAEQDKQRVKDEALAAANDRILKSEVKAAAKGVLEDPTDAFKYLDLSKFEVDVDGNVDEAAIASALADLLKAKSYLAAQSSKRFQGTADGGARNGSATSIDDQIAAATAAGNHLLAINLKQQRSAAASKS